MGAPGNLRLLLPVLVVLATMGVAFAENQPWTEPHYVQDWTWSTYSLYDGSIPSQLYLDVWNEEAYWADGVMVGVGYNPAWLTWDKVRETYHYILSEYTNAYVWICNVGSSPINLGNAYADLFITRYETGDKHGVAKGYVDIGTLNPGYCKVGEVSYWDFPNYLQATTDAGSSYSWDIYNGDIWDIDRWHMHTYFGIADYWVKLREGAMQGLGDAQDIWISNKAPDEW